jgi:Zn-dependent peptidase ImmA (M78 family)/DNA-binding XRE family transcriptional regulator
MPLDGLELNPGVIGPNIAAARRRRSLSQADLAKRVGVSRPTLIAFEAGQRSPGPEMLTTIAAELETRVRDLAMLPKYDSQAEIRFRSPIRDDKTAAGAVQALSDFARYYVLMQDVAGKSFQQPSVIAISIEEASDVEHAAEDLAAAERARLSLGDGPLLDLRAVLEQDIGMLVFGLRELQSAKIAGIFMYANDLPLIGFNVQQSDPRRQRWTLAHEYAHYLTNRYDPEITYVTENRRSRSRQEQFAEIFATNFLMPASGVSRRFAKIAGHAQHTTLAHIILLADQFHVSFQAMCNRLESLGRIPRNTYDHAMAKGLRPVEAERALGIDRRTESLPPYPARYLYLLSLLLRRGTLTEGDAAHYLQTDDLSARDILHAFEPTSSNQIDEPLRAL